jgi:hypothetical protein
MISPAPMKASVTDWIRTGAIAPLHWSMSLQDMLLLWPSAQAQADDLLARGYPFFLLDECEFYFQDEELTHLCEVVIKVLNLCEPSHAAYLDYGWLRADLPLPKVRAILDQSAIAYEPERGPSFQTPNLRTSHGILLAFDSTVEKEEDTQLLKLYFTEQPALSLTTFQVK